MNKWISAICIAALVLPITSSADQSARQGAERGPVRATASMDEPASIRAFRAINDGMHQGMSLDYTGDADIDFVKAMIPHHQGAVAMAEVVLAHGKDQAVRELAKQAIEVRQAEIAMLRNWLEARGH